MVLHFALLVFITSCVKVITFRVVITSCVNGITYRGYYYILRQYYILRRNRRSTRIRNSTSMVLWPWSLVKTDILRQIWLRKRCGLTSSSWLGLPMSTVIRVTLTALLLRCPWQQRFFDIQTSANLRKFVLSFVSSISLKNRMPVIPFASERVFNSATFLPMLIPLKTLRNVSNLHLKIYSG